MRAAYRRSEPLYLQIPAKIENPGAGTLGHVGKFHSGDSTALLPPAGVAHRSGIAEYFRMAGFTAVS
jgi:hypothetical protein